MNKQKVGPDAEYVNSNGQMRARVQSNAAAIGYVGLGFVDSTVKALDVNGIAAGSRHRGRRKISHRPAVVHVHQRISEDGLASERLRDASI